MAFNIALLHGKVQKNTEKEQVEIKKQEEEVKGESGQ